VIPAPFFVNLRRAYSALHSFTTRRSSDLQPSWNVNHGVLWEVEEDEKGFYFTSRVHDPKQTAQTLSMDNNGNLVISERKIADNRSEEHTSELQSRFDLVCRLLLEKKNQIV